MKNLNSYNCHINIVMSNFNWMCSSPFLKNQIKLGTLEYNLIDYRLSGKPNLR